MLSLLRSLWRKRKWGRAASRVRRPVEYLRIERSHPPGEVHGWIPRESAEECGLVVPEWFPQPDRGVWIDLDVGKRLRQHPLWLDDEKFHQLEAEEETK